MGVLDYILIVIGFGLVIFFCDRIKKKPALIEKQNIGRNNMENETYFVGKANIDGVLVDVALSKKVVLSGAKRAKKHPEDFR